MQIQLLIENAKPVVKQGRKFKGSCEKIAWLPKIIILKKEFFMKKLGIIVSFLLVSCLLVSSAYATTLFYNDVIILFKRFYLVTILLQ